MAVTLDSSTTGTNTHGASLSYALNNAAGTFLNVDVGWQENESRSISSVTYNSVSLTQLSGARREAGPIFGIFMGVDRWGLLEPATGSHNVVVTPNTETHIYSGASTWTGHDTSAPYGTAVAATGPNGNTTANTGTITLTTTGGVAIGVATGLGNATSWTPGQTQIWESFRSGVDDLTSAGEYRTDSGALTWTGVDNFGTTNWVASGVEIKAAAGGGGAVPIAAKSYYYNIGVMQ